MATASQPDPLATFQQMRNLVHADNTLPYGERIKLLKSLRTGLKTKQNALIKAIDQDFQGRARQETIIADILPTLGIIDYTIKHLRKWMKPRRRHVALHFIPAKNRILMQPKGVVLIISPWNYPISLSILPMVTAIAAGNRVILKPSEFTPKTSDLIAELVHGALPADRATVMTGGADVSITLCKLPFDHILFTGSTNVGREVMKSAAENLTPVTLELGGKSPAVIHGDYDLATAAMRIARGKLLNAGQTCIAPDYVLLARDKIDAFVTHYNDVITRFYPDIQDNNDYTTIINQHHFDRLKALLQDAKAKGATVQVVGASATGSSGQHKLHPHVILDTSDDMQICHEEIFGPLLPIIAYDSLDQASAYINQRARPLALYYFDNDKQRVNAFLAATTSGGAAINDTVLHFVQDDLPFGGVGASGMGVCHGHEGFCELSHAKPVFYQARLNSTAILNPPYGATFERIIKFLTR